MDSSGKRDKQLPIIAQPDHLVGAQSTGIMAVIVYI